MSSIREKVEFFARAPRLTAMSMVRCGFELETNMCNTYDNDHRYCSSCNEDCECDGDYNHHAFNLEELKACTLIKRDLTVAGPEITTDGALKAKDFLKILKQLTEKNGLSVDKQCSFHIHISLPDIQHCWGAKFQLALYEYLFLNLDKVPKKVRERWNSHSWRNQYFCLYLDPEKYTFVHQHAKLNTWEFRCFGNINTYDDGKACLELAVGAMQHAYRCILGLDSLLLSTRSHYRDILENALKQNLPLMTYLQTLEAEVA